MNARENVRRIRRWGLGAIVTTMGMGVAVAALSWARPPANVPTASLAPTAETKTPPPADPSDYCARPVAHLGHDSIITREELGEYLIARRGAEKVDMLVNRRVIDLACQEAGVEVTAAEVEASLAADLKGLGNITQGDFVKQVLRKYNKNLIEWKEDVIRPKLMLAKLSKTKIQVTDDDLREAFEAHYGEKIDCRVIQWPKSAEAVARAAYPKVKASEQEFGDYAKRQADSGLASTGGKIKPLTRHLAVFNPISQNRDMNELVEKEAFQLKPGDVSPLLEGKDGFLVLKCDQRLPADTSVNPTAIRDDLTREVIEHKIQEENPKIFRSLRDRAHPQPVYTANPGTPPVFTPGCSRGRVVAYIYDKVPVTREDLGEFLLTRYGSESLDLLVNKHIIDDACKAQGIRVEPSDIEVALNEKVASLHVPLNYFLTQLLTEYKTTLGQYKEDVLKPQIQLARLSADQVHVTDEDMRMAFEAYYGEKVECRIILWPREEKKNAMAEYGKLRDSEQAFAERASRQASPALARAGGRLMDNENKVRAIGMHTLGNKELEREIFSLQPGDVSKLVETPEGIVVVKCDRRIPADANAKIEVERERLAKEVKERKTQVEIPLVFAALRKAAEPKLLLSDPNRPVDIKAEVARDLNGSQPGKKTGKSPTGN